MANYPRFSAHNEQTEPHRITRLKEVWAHAVQGAHYFGNYELQDRVVELRDHKGQLTVSWRQPPAAGEKEFFGKAWQVAGDGTLNVIHEMSPM